MAFVAVAATVGTTIGLGGTAAIIGGGALIGAGVGGLYSAVTGDGNILNSMLTGGLIGGAGAFGLGSFGLGGAEAQALMAGPFWGGAPGTVPMVTPGAATTVSTPTPALEAAKGLTASSSPAAFEAAAAAQGVYPEGAAALRGAGMTVAPDVVTPQMIAQGAAPVAGSGPSGMKMLGYGLAGTTALSLLGGKQKGPGAGTMPDPGSIRPFEYTSTPTTPTGDYPAPYATARYESSGNPILDTRERNYFDQGFAAMQPYSAKIGAANPNIPLPSSSPIAAASGGIMRNYDDELGGDYSAMGMDQGNLQKGLFNMGYAAGGMTSLGGYSDGGRMLKGPGDGMSDSIPGVIGSKQPARLADGEFVVPADVVSHLGNGSTDAGAKRLYAMMDKVRKARTGNKKQGKQIKAEKYLPA